MEKEIIPNVTERNRRIVRHPTDREIMDEENKIAIQDAMAEEFGYDDVDWSD